MTNAVLTSDYTKLAHESEFCFLALIILYLHQFWCCSFSSLRGMDSFSCFEVDFFMRVRGCLESCVLVWSFNLSVPVSYTHLTLPTNREV